MDNVDLFGYKVDLDLKMVFSYTVTQKGHKFRGTKTNQKASS